MAHYRDTVRPSCCHSFVKRLSYLPILSAFREAVFLTKELIKQLWIFLLSKTSNSNRNSNLFPQEKLLKAFDAGNYDEFFEIWKEKFSEKTDEQALILEFYLHVYFAIYPLRVSDKKTVTSTVTTIAIVVLIVNTKFWRETASPKILKCNCIRDAYVEQNYAVFREAVFILTIITKLLGPTVFQNDSESVCSFDCLLCIVFRSQIPELWSVF